MTNTTRAARTAGADPIALLFAGAHRQGRKILTRAELAAVATVHGVTDAQITAAIRDGRLRTGVTGVWLREEADPGALEVMRAALRSRNDADHDNA